MDLHWYSVYSLACVGDVLKALLPAGLLGLYAGSVPLPEQVDARRSWGICLASHVALGPHGNVRGCVFAVRPELEEPKSDLTEMTVVRRIEVFRHRPFAEETRHPIDPIFT